MLLCQTSASALMQGHLVCRVWLRGPCLASASQMNKLRRNLGQPLLPLAAVQAVPQGPAPPAAVHRTQQASLNISQALVKILWPRALHTIPAWLQWFQKFSLSLTRSYENLGRDGRCLHSARVAGEPLSLVCSFGASYMGYHNFAQQNSPFFNELTFVLLPDMSQRPVTLP